LLAQSAQFDLYLIDNWMAGTTGIDLCIRLREIDSYTPILFFSGLRMSRTNARQWRWARKDI